MKQLTIMGLGLMGASLGLAARRRGVAGRVCGYARREETRREAERLGVVHAAFDDPAEAAAGADMVVLCVPILSMPELVERFLPALRAGAVVTDVGSTKAELVERLTPPVRRAGAAFVGSHPIAGSEAVGIEAAFERLYEGAVVIVTPGPCQAEDEGCVRDVVQLWRQVGAGVRMMDPAGHDRMLARTSHLPHLAAAAIAAAVLREDGERVHDFCGSGFRDTTRVAAGSELLWHDIVRTNCAALDAELEQLQRVLGELRTLIAAKDFEGVKAFLAEAGRLRRGADRRAGMPELDSGPAETT